MIIVGTYPDGFEATENSSKLQVLESVLQALLPKQLGLHVLPFYPNSGDFGFAPDDWFRVRSDLGKWDDLASLALNWKIIVDGIYNHVGVNHKWVKEFLDNPEEYKVLIHAYRGIAPDQGPTSPRGQPVLTPSISDYYLWKTFTDAAVDIRLENRVVQDEIDSHLSFLFSLGIWGVRLDAVAYYAKAFGKQIRHNPGVFELANGMADKVRSHGLRVLAQLDCDEEGIRYYADDKRKIIPICDFTYSTCLALSILEENPLSLINHVVETQKTGRILIRIPRTHDGILLRSKLLKQNEKNKIMDFAKVHNIGIRTSSGDPYELNCSAPYLFSLIAPELELAKTILFTIAITGMISGWSYFYLPYIMGHVPERNANDDAFRDPRSINRTPIPSSVIENYFRSPNKDRIFSLLNLLHVVHMSQGDDFRSDSFVDGELLILITADERYNLVANFSKTTSKNVPSKWSKGQVLDCNDFDGNTIGPLGYVIMTII